LATTAAAPAVRPTDFLDIDHLLSDEERLIRDTVRRFVQERVVPHVGEWFEAGTIPRELATELGALNVLGMHLEGYGCAGDDRDPPLGLGGAEAGVAAADGRR
jgi:glutaryl-CoA dehydrogenase